jgi:flagellar assembly protein FliH
MEQHPFDLGRRLAAGKISDLALELWQPPAIEDGEHLVYAKAKPSAKLPEEPDLGEIARREGYDTGLKKGREEGFAKGQEEGLIAGKNEAVAQAAKEMQPKLRELNQLLTTLTHSLNEEDYSLEKTLFELVKIIAVSVIRKELELDPGSLMKVVKETISALPHSRDNIKIMLNPADKEFADAAISEGGENWRVIGDGEIARGGCKIVTDQSEADASIEHRIEAVLNQLYEQKAIGPKPGEAEFEEAPEPAVSPNSSAPEPVEASPNQASADQEPQ